MFEYLNAGKRGATLDLASEDDLATVRELIAQAHLLVEALPAGTLGRAGLDVAALEALSPGLVVVRISDFGQHGPLCDRDATPLTMQAASGWISTRDPDRPPVQAGARISEYVAGGYGALGALTALRTRSADPGRLVEVDVSVLESLLSTLPYPMLMAEQMRSLGLSGNTRAAPMMGIVRAADGWLGINCLTGQHWLDACAMLGMPEYVEQQLAIMRGGPERAEFFAKAQPWLSDRTVADIVELSQAMRIPPQGSTTAPLRCTARNTATAGSSWTAVAMTGHFAAPARHFGCRRHPCYPGGSRRASVQPLRLTRNNPIAGLLARPRIQPRHSQA